jgi:hypothetical protein
MINKIKIWTIKFKERILKYMDKFNFWEKHKSIEQSPRRINIISSLNWVLSIIYPSSFAYLKFSEDVIGKIFVMCIDIILLVFYLRKWHYFSIKDPDRLQTEEFVVRIKEIEISQRQGFEPEIGNSLKVTSKPKELLNGNRG